MMNFGDGRLGCSTGIVEVYPAAALKMWGMPEERYVTYRAYKKAKPAANKKRTSSTGEAAASAFVSNGDTKKAETKESRGLQVVGWLNRPGYPGDSIPWKRGWSHGQASIIKAVPG